MRIELEVWRSALGRPEGTIHAVDGGNPRPFVGTLDLLRHLEDLTGPARGAARRITAGTGERPSTTSAPSNEQEGWA